MLTTTRVASGLSQPLFVTSPPGDTDRLFIVERAGVVKILKNGAVLGTPFLSITAKVGSTSSERGLFSLAFHPDYDNTGFFFLYYTRTDGASIVERYQVSANQDVANAASGTVMVGPVAQFAGNHNGGQIAFGPDGYLYFALGDGGGSNDGACNAQKPGELLGKMLRIDVDNGGAAPPTNPFVGNPAYDPRIWAVGLRNPFRFSFDRLNGDLYIGDVGQNAREEVNWVPGTSAGGENYGWKIMEGEICGPNLINCPGGLPACNSPALTDPVHVYNWANGRAVIGGFVYRGCAIPDLKGTYFFADHGHNNIWSFKMVGGVKTAFVERTAELAPGGGLSISSIAGFGEDACGEIYLCDRNGGEIFKIIPRGVPAPGETLGFGKAGTNGKIPDLKICGILTSGQSAELQLRHGAPSQPALLLASNSQTPTPYLGTTLVPTIPPNLQFVLPMDSNGDLFLPIPGGSGPLSLWVQYFCGDPGLPPVGYSISEAVRIDLAP